MAFIDRSTGNTVGPELGLSRVHGEQIKRASRDANHIVEGSNLPRVGFAVVPTLALALALAFIFVTTRFELEAYLFSQTGLTKTYDVSIAALR